MKKYNSNLDILRICACFLVLTIHIGAQLGWNERTGVGAFGVQLFFIMSGFLSIGAYEQIYQNYDKPIISYYCNRIRRIVPLYYTVVTVHCLIAVSEHFFNGGGFEIFTDGTLCVYVRYFMFMQCILPSDNYGIGCNIGALWTMSAFALFYLILPISYKLINGYRRSVIVLMFLLVTNNSMKNWIAHYLSGWPETSEPVLFSRTWAFANLYCFMFGICIYYAIKERKEIHYALILLAVLLWHSLCFMVIEIVFTYVVMMFATDANISTNEKYISVIKFLSGGTWALYLFHPVILLYDNRFVITYNITNVWSRLFVYLLTVLVGFYAVYYLIIKIRNKNERIR